MADDQSMRERIARALWIGDHPYLPPDSDMTPNERRGYAAEADAVLAAMEEPTADMTVAAANVVVDADHKSDYGYAIAVDDVAVVWTVMIRAAREGK